MTTNRNPIEYVFASTARRRTLSILARTPTDRRSIVERVDASESAVYDAFAGLAERGLIYRTDEGWSVTGAGRAIADCLDRCDRVGDAIREVGQYWRTHDASVLPRRLREALFAAPSAEIYRSPDADPERAGREVAGLLVDSDRADVLTAVYWPPVVDAVGGRPNGRLLVAPSLLEADDARPTGDAAVRTAAVDYSLVVADDAVALSVPTLDGRLDRYAALVSTDDAVRARCRRAFESAWRRAADPTHRERTRASQG